MEKITFKTVINATPEKIWEVLWNDDTYRKWTAVFSEGSHAETDWREGSKVLFLDGTGQGMVSKIAKNRPNEFMSIEHLGEVKDGIEDINSEKVKVWAGAHENYTLKKINGTTELTVDMDVTSDFKDYFQQTWPKALESVKGLAE